MRRGNWLDDDFPKHGWKVIDKRAVAAQQCGMCCTSVCRTIYHLEHAGPPYRRIEAGKDCAAMLTDGDMRTRAERERARQSAERERAWQEAWQEAEREGARQGAERERAWQEAKRERAEHEAERRREADYFRRAEASPWDFASFRDVGWRESQKGNPTRQLADGRVTLFNKNGGWKVAICLDGAEPAFSNRIYSSFGEAQQVAWDFLPRVRARSANPCGK